MDLQGRGDLRAAEHLLELVEGCPFGPVCFNAQHCAEKYLNALLVWEQIPFKRVHDIAELVALVPEAKRPSLPLSAQDRLTHYAVAARYPDEEPSLGRGEAVAALQTAREIRQAVGAWLPLEVMPPFRSA